MYTFDEVQLPITMEEIQSKVTDKQIFERYCINFKSLNKPFLSAFYDDNNPSCRIREHNGKLYSQDFGTGDYYGCFDYIQRKYNCTFSEALNIVANDFNIKQI